MPQASAPPAPAGGVPGTGAGKSVVRGAAPSSVSGADLAALFADLVANAGLGIHEAAVEHDRPADSVPVEGEPDAAGEEDNAGLLEGPPSAAWQPPLLPWQWTIRSSGLVNIASSPDGEKGHWSLGRSR